MYIEELETQLVALLKDTKAFKAVKRYKGELDNIEMLRTVAGNTPSIMLFTSAIADSEGLDQAEAEQLDITVLLLVSSEPERNKLHELRARIKRALYAYTNSSLLMPITSVRTDTLAITPSTSVYAMIFNCEILCSPRRG